MNNKNTGGDVIKMRREDERWESSSATSSPTIIKGNEVTTKKKE